MNGYTTVINFLISIPLECRTDSLFTLYAGKWADEDRTQLNLWRRKTAHKQLQEMLICSPVAFLSQAKGPTKLRSSCYTKTGFYTISLLKQSSLPPTMSAPSCVVVCTVMVHHPQHLGSNDTAQPISSGPQRHGMAETWTAHPWRPQVARRHEGKHCSCAQMIRKTLLVLY